MIVLILTALILGIGLGYFDIYPLVLKTNINEISEWLLFVILFLVGIDVGSNRRILKEIKETGLRILLIPFVIIIGSLTGGIFMCIIGNFSIFETLAISSGMGYYSLSSIILTQMINSNLGIIAFLSNIMREVITLIITPFVARLSKLLPIASGAATSMDTTLPVILKFTSKKTGLIAVISGVIITLLVPLLVTFFASLILKSG